MTLFTSGMSERPMNVPDGESLYAFAELFIQLPKDWKYQDLQNPQWNWPILWLRASLVFPTTEKHGWEGLSRSSRKTSADADCSWRPIYINARSGGTSFPDRSGGNAATLPAHPASYR